MEVTLSFSVQTHKLQRVGTVRRRTVLGCLTPETCLPGLVRQACNSLTNLCVCETLWPNQHFSLKRKTGKITLRRPLGVIVYSRHAARSNEDNAALLLIPPRRCHSELSVVHFCFFFFFNRNVNLQAKCNATKCWCDLFNGLLLLAN